MSIELAFRVDYGTLWLLIGAALVVFITLLIVGRKS